MNNDPMEKIRKILDESEFIKMLGIEISELDDDHALGRMPFKSLYLNPYGSMHGGCLYSLADTVAGSLANSMGGNVMTVEGKLSFLEAAWDTQYVYCLARLRRCGSHLINVDVDITDDNKKLLDCGNFTFFRIENR